MKIAVIGSENQRSLFNQFNSEIEWIGIASVEEANGLTGISAFFNMEASAWKEDYSKLNTAVFINSVSHTLKEKNHDQHVIRFNGWNGFPERAIWEYAGIANETHISIAALMQKKLVEVPDEPGFISARVIGMIINEAYFAKGEKVSTEDEIDTAMKLGTNYPKGPFEWKREIGIQPIFELLDTLKQQDDRYLPAPELTKEALNG